MVTRITLIAPELTHNGGQERATLYLARHLLERGHSVQAVSRAADASLHHNPNFRLHRVRTPGRPILARYVGFLIAATRIARTLPATDAVLNTENSSLVPCDVAYSHFCHSAYRRRRILRLQSASRNLYCFAFDALNSAVEQAVYRRLSRAVVAVSHQHKAELVQEAHVPAHRVRVVHNGVDTDEFFPSPTDAARGQLRAEFGVPAHASVLLFAGDLRSPRKGLDSLLLALPRLPQAVHLLICGETRGSPYPSVVRRTGLSDRAHFTGFRRDLSAIMRAADLFVLPTHYDPFGLVIIEAMASGLPVITTSRAGATEIMADGVDGLVLDDPDDAVALANSVMDLLGAPERRQAMGVAARETALNYDWRRVAARIEHLLLQDPAACAIP